ncbi:riboflavin kinase / FMN adenylyltransferase [Desulfonispora thiosulfatigenes DSM 11270]|uniref:Riboflavin biosynthesis protein n=1 Tax=Desulfonispora thiosulfatigenes DSM 11270 TaxID=656914 RepID=A0A1W1VLB3_DESTI|nr:bifunctional riboflavin kinase/FAD synthetase [Desulfonispora thiosulfatigenes]SMB94118.1 riboflavin kinase / FMN adenylyltransferase [Desulfonispora thiosulfatigenes DSM 11270]
MKVFKSLESVEKENKPLVITLGNFDGVHLGHQNLISSAMEIANDIDGEVMVFTFSHHPQMILGKKLNLINTFNHKTKLIEDLGVHKLLAPPFTKEIARLAPKQFVKDVLHDLLDAKHIIVGFNYSFGYRGEGKADDLVNLNNKYGIKTTIISPFYVENEVVSSTRIREYLLQGDIDKASQLLSYKPRLSGKVVHGNKLGRSIGFPTANLAWEKGLIIPACGVYAVEIDIGGIRYQGVLNIGYKPTVTRDKRLSIEVNLLDFSKDIYNQDLEIIFNKRLRGEKKFNNLDELKTQISEDVLKTRSIFKTNI